MDMLHVTDRERKPVSVAEARQTLGVNDKEMTDEQIQELIIQLEDMAHYVIKNFKELRQAYKSRNEHSKSLTP